MMRNFQNFYVILSISILAIFVVLFVVSLLQGCEDECESLDVKCDGTLLLICNDNGEWEFVADCQDYIPDDWTCCDINGETSCYPIEECQDVK